VAHPARKALLLFCLIAGAFPASATTLTNQAYGFALSSWQEWRFRPAPLPAGRIFELFRAYPAPAAGGDALAGRVYLDIDNSGKRLIEIARGTVAAVRNRHFEVRDREQRREAGFAVLYYRLLQSASRDGTERDLWITIRFFRHREKNYAFWAASRSAAELVETDMIFRSLRALPGDTLQAQ
jgi:hypothetical protein